MQISGPFYFSNDTNQLKQEMAGLQRFNGIDTEKVIRVYEKDGIEKAVGSARRATSDTVVNKLERMENILNSDKQHKGKDYIEAVAKDDLIMKYVDLALADGKKFSTYAPKENNLLVYANQRDFNQTLAEIKETNVAIQFRENIENLKKYTQSQDVKDCISIFQEKGIKQFIAISEIKCSKAIADKIDQDLLLINRNKLVKGFNEGQYRSKSEYLSSINSDKNLMQYINRESRIGKELEQQNQVNNKDQSINKDFDIER